MAAHFHRQKLIRAPRPADSPAWTQEEIILDPYNLLPYEGQRLIVG